MQKKKKSVLLTTIVAILSLAAIAYGFRSMIQYERTPGRIGEVPVAWPSNSSITPATDRATLLVFAHPRCPCTRATIAELAELIAHTPGKLRAYVIFFRPENSNADWTDTDLEQSARAIPGVTIMRDADAAEAKRFGAETSGHALLFGADGHLLFNGGITASRGHAGENAGESAIVSLVNGHSAPLNRSLVFGCSLLERDRLAQTSSR